jgi:hypothetical protein
MGKNIVYVASCLDLATGERLQSSKVGIATSDADKRIRTLNSTKQPFAVELEAAWSFENTDLSAEAVEAAIHALLEPDRINGEWFRDAEGDLPDRVGRAILKLGGAPVGDENQDLAEMNDRQRNARQRMEAVFEPIRDQLVEIGINWDYMTWLVGIDSGIGRLKVRVTKRSGLYVVKGHCQFTAEELENATGLDWRTGEQQRRVMCSGLSSEQLVHFLNVTKDWLTDE